MSLRVQCGLPGAGKSYNAVLRVCDALEQGRCVVTNLPLNLDNSYFEEYLKAEQLIMFPKPSELDKKPEEDFGRYASWERFASADNPYIREIKTKKGKAAKIGALIIVDEAQNCLTPMIRANKKEPHEFDQLTAMFRTHRHMLIDIILLYHDHSSVDSKIKPLIEMWYHIVNVSEHYGFDSYVVKLSNKGYMPSSKGHTDKNMRRFKPEIFERYDSYAEGAGEGTKGKKGVLGLAGPKLFWLRFPVLLFGATVILVPITIFIAVKKSKSAITQQPVAAISRVDTSTQNTGRSESGNDQLLQRLIAGEDGQVLETTESGAEIGPYGLPSENMKLLGFDSYSLYFESGQIVRREIDLTPKGWRVLKATPCAVTLARQPEPPDYGYPAIINYTCSKGF